MSRLKQPFQTVRAITAVLVISILVSSCTIKLAYNFLDWGLFWQLEDYVKFNRDQRSLVKKEIGKLVDWHRSDELPQYADKLEKLADGLASGLTIEQLNQTYNALSDGWQRIVVETLPAATEILSNLTDQQINTFFAILIEEEEDDARDIKRDTPEQLITENEEYIREKLVDLIGKLNAEQKLLIATWAQDIEPAEQLSLDHSIQWRTKMQAAMANRQDKQQLEQTLMVLFANPDTLWSNQYRQVIEKNQRLIIKLLFDINQILTDKQRDKLISKLNSFIKDLRDLSR
jgi:hypothetical protein